jgi:hypothetical protein
MQRRPRAGVAVAARAWPATRKIDDLMWFEPGSSGDLEIAANKRLLEGHCGSG